LCELIIGVIHFYVLFKQQRFGWWWSWWLLPAIPWSSMCSVCGQQKHIRPNQHWTWPHGGGYDRSEWKQTHPRSVLSVLSMTPYYIQPFREG